MKSVKCHICSRENEISEDAFFCVSCGADLSNPATESLLMESKKEGSYATSDKLTDVRKNAYIYLTNKRLIVIPADVKYAGIGITGALTALAAQATWNIIKSNQPNLISIPLERFKTQRDGRFGLLVKALIIETKDNEIIKIAAPNLKEWKDAITKAAKI